MLSKSQLKLIRSLHSKRGREKSGLCLVEGEKVVRLAGKAVDFTFTSNDTPEFAELVTTETPQAMAGVARVPQWTNDDIRQAKTIVVLDGVQDPGNVGSILRLCLGFNASLLLVESADVTNPKVVRSSVGALFQVPWKILERTQVDTYLEHINRPVFRLEKTTSAKPVQHIQEQPECVVIAGSEGSGIQLPTAGTSLAIPHIAELESLNVTHALAIALYLRYA